MLGFAILLGFLSLGYVCHYMLHIPLPPNVIGLILFTLSLFLKLIKLEWVEQAAELLLRHMLLFFAPVVVGTMVFLSLFAEQWLPIAVGLIGSLLATLLVTGKVASWVMSKQEDQG